MSARAHTRRADPEPLAPEAWERALLDERLAMLGRLAEMGMELAAAIKDQATPERLAQDGAAGAVAMAFSRASRAVRMALALQSRLIQDFKARPKAGAAEAAPARGPVELRWLEPETVRRRRVADIVRTLAEDADLDAETVERVAAEAGERLEQDEIYGAVMTRAVGDLVAQICRDLGLGAEAIACPASLERALAMSWDFDTPVARGADPLAAAAARRAGGQGPLAGAAPAGGAGAAPAGGAGPGGPSPRFDGSS
jgi:hypothetical protein